MDVDRPRPSMDLDRPRLARRATSSGPIRQVRAAPMDEDDGFTTVKKRRDVRV